MSKQNHLFLKTYNGALWTLLDMLFSKGIPIIVVIMIARVLGPAEFGLYGVLILFVAIGLLLYESGMTTSLIRHPRLSPLDYSTVFYLNLFVSLMIYGAVFVTAPMIALFFERPLLTELIRTVSLVFLINALSAVHLAILNKKMRFRKIAILNLPGTFIGGLFALYAAHQQWGIWSIVYMNLISQSITTLVLWMVIKWRPGIEYSSSKAGLHFKFGIFILLSGLLDTFFKNIYNILIGKFYPIQSLAFFERARSLQEYPSVAITAISNKVSYPMMARLQHDALESNSFFKRLIQVTFMINTPFILIVAAVAHPLFMLVLGKAWEQAVPYFQILCIGSIFYPHHAYNLNVLKVKGRSDLFLRLEIYKKLLMTLIVIASFPFGIYGMLWGMVLSSLLALYINIYYSGDFIDYTFKQQLQDLLPNAFIGLASFLLTYTFCKQINFMWVGWQITISMLVGMFIYTGLSYFANRKEFELLLNLVMNR